MSPPSPLARSCWRTSSRPCRRALPPAHGQRSCCARNEEVPRAACRGTAGLPKRSRSAPASGHRFRAHSSGAPRGGDSEPNATGYRRKAAIGRLRSTARSRTCRPPAHSARGTLATALEGDRNGGTPVSHERADAARSREAPMEPDETMQIKVTENGPYLVSGSVPIARQTIVADAEGNSIGWRQGQTYETKENCALCRCGQSANKPFCDGSHARVGFQGAETASREPYLREADVQEGTPEVAGD